ncbi:phytanoyl-CoA dioxygenase domain-containing protein 1-like isoform X2 [Ornithodoros turicata]|uniref:phytanoyl-CoA dioxygenase domain-containing protein 1-like isoform X2 n=1 Tax=Ornithodoros turicata TaxID=34597 RepID=UPI0031391255
MEKDILKSYIENFYAEGMVSIPNFLPESDVTEMKQECARLVDQINWSENPTFFKTTGDQARNEYFLNSGDKIRYFFEEEAFDSEGNLVVSKDACLNKVGHALHWLRPAFRRVSFSEKVKELVRLIGFIDPVIVQSMFIFKNPGIGGTEPRKLIGLWFPLEDATLENGCLWYIPKSHLNDEISRRFVRNPEKCGPLLKFVGQKDDYSNRGTFMPLPTPKGSCVVIHGNVVHKSEKNTSQHPRPAYTFHIIDRHCSVYSPENWLQPTEDLPFPSLYNNE